MKTLKASTDPSIITARSTLSTDVSAGSNVTIPLLNNSGFADTYFVAIGYGGEGGELQQINQAVTAGSNIRVATLTRDHKAGEKVVVMRFNQRKFYGSATRDGSYTELSGSPVTIKVDGPEGATLAYTGTEYSYFKATYYNSTDLIETSVDDAIPIASDESRRYATISAIRSRAGLDRSIRISDAEFERARIRAEAAIDSALCNRYVLPLTADPIPAIINTICEDWAAGWILIEKEIDKEGKGEKYMKSAKQDLEDIASGKTILIGIDGLQISASNRVSISGFPDGGVLDTTERMFTVDQKF